MCTKRCAEKTNQHRLVSGLENKYAPIYGA
jgi:hypothetical protein